MSCTRSPSPLSQTRPATLALCTAGLETTLVTEAVRAIGNWVEVTEAVLVIEVIPVASGSSTLTLKVAVRLCPGASAYSEASSGGSPPATLTS